MLHLYVLNLQLFYVYVLFYKVFSLTYISWFSFIRKRALVVSSFHFDLYLSQTRFPLGYFRALFACSFRCTTFSRFFLYVREFWSRVINELLKNLADVLNWLSPRYLHVTNPELSRGGGLGIFSGKFSSRGRLTTFPPKSSSVICKIYPLSDLNGEPCTPCSLLWIRYYYLLVN